MGRRTKIPKDATLVGHIKGTVDSPGQPNHGQPVEMYLYKGYKSLGYKSDYTRIRMAWTEIFMPAFYRVFQHSGKNYDDAAASFNATKQIIKE